MRLTPIKPFGLMVEAPRNQARLDNLSEDTIIDLLNKHFLIVFRNYSYLQDEEYINFAKQFGDLLAWEFGEILELKTSPNPANHIFTAGRVELHWDGAFVEEEPHFNLFQCIKGSREAEGGQTLFVNTTAVLEHASDREMDLWAGTRIRYRTEKKAHYGGCIERHLLDRNPYSGRKIIRYIEAFNEDNKDINPMEVRVLGYSSAESNAFLQTMTIRLYEIDVMYRHSWQDGDFVIADNSHLLHGRSKFTNAKIHRHIKRINIL